MVESKAAVLTATGGEWEICDLTVDRPREGEVLVRMTFAGLCYSDEHVRFDKNARLPVEHRVHGRRHIPVPRFAARVPHRRARRVLRPRDVLAVRGRLPERLR